jgi:hypothetical protein
MNAANERLSAALADRYRIERELGAGGMATVFLAHDIKHDRKVALKVLKPELAAVLGAERFVVEIKTTAALQHPHILPLFDSGTADGFLFYVMPFIDGETLRSKLDRETQLGIEDAVRIATDVAGALDYAHRHGVIHRDIKPENILLHDGRPMVADFGIALAVSAAAGGRMTETGLSLGTPHYMSPEQATAEKEISARSDIYSLASVLYEMLAGEPPHMGNSAQQIIMKIIAEPAQPVTKLRKSVPPNVATAVEKALEKLPADRFESAAAFSAALHNPAFATATVTAKSHGGNRPWFADRRLMAAFAVAAVSLATAFAVVRTREDDADLGNVSIVRNTFEQEFIFNARWLSDGKTIIYSAGKRGELGASLMPGRMAAANSRLYVIRPDYPVPQPFGPDSAHLLAVSSAGELALLTHPRYINHRLFAGTLARMPAGGGAAREILENVQEADWSPDGSELAVTRSVGDRDQLEFPVGRVLYRSGIGGYLSDPRVSPGGDVVVLVDHPIRYDDRGSVMLVDTGGTVTAIAPDFWGVEGMAWHADGRSVLFSGVEVAGAYRVHRAGIGMKPQPLLPTTGDLTLHDESAAGLWLVTRDDQPRRLIVRPPGATSVLDMSWLDGSIHPRISRDGELFAFTDQSVTGGPNYSVMVRKTDGSAAIRLGEGNAEAISPDKRWVVGALPTAPKQYRLYPTGAGESRSLTWAGLESVSQVDFFPDGSSLFVCGNEKGKSPRCYRSPRDATRVEPVTVDGVGAGLLRPDGLAVAVSRSDGWWVFPLGEGTPRLVPGTSGAIVSRWSPDGKALWVLIDAGPRPRFDRVDVDTGLRTPLVTIDLPTDIPVFAVLTITLADDPRVYAYTAWSYTSSLFTVEGVR